MYDNLLTNITFHCILTGAEVEDLTLCFGTRLPLVHFFGHFKWFA
jgi:hypothetical protein